MRREHDVPNSQSFDQRNGGEAKKYDSVALTAGLNAEDTRKPYVRRVALPSKQLGTVESKRLCADQHFAVLWFGNSETRNF